MKQIVFIFVVFFLLAAPVQGKELTKKTARVERYDLAEITLLDLETAQRIALQDNPGLGAAQARLEQGKAVLKQAIASGRPSVDASASTGVGRYSETDYESFSDSSIDQNYEAGSLTLEASWTLFDGYSVKFQREQARYGVQAYEKSKKDTQRMLVSAVADAFFTAQQALAAIEIAAANKDFYEQQLQDAESRQEVGSGSLSDVLNIKVQLNTARNTLLTSERNYEITRYALAALMGIEYSVLPEEVKLAELDKECDISTEKSLADQDKLIAEALQARPDLAYLDMQIKQAESGIQQAKSGDWPIVQLVGQVTGSTADGLAPTGNDVEGSLVVSASWNLYSGGAVDATVLEAREAKREARYSYVELRNSIASEVKQDIARLSAAREQVRLQRETVELVEENRTLAKSEYEAGSASLVRLNEAQRDLTATYGELVQALVSYQQARHQLLAAVGRNLVPFASSDEVRTLNK